MTAKITRTEALEIARSTEDAYSFDRYRNWGACALALRNLGYDARETEAILRSKHMRWAADMSDKRYGAVTSADLLRYIEKHQKYLTGEALKALVAFN